MKNFFGSGLFSMGLSDKGKQKYFIFGPTIFAIPFHEYSISHRVGSRNFENGVHKILEFRITVFFLCLVVASL